MKDTQDYFVRLHEDQKDADREISQAAQIGRNTSPPLVEPPPSLFGPSGTTGGKGLFDLMGAGTAGKEEEKVPGSKVFGPRESFAIHTPPTMPDFDANRLPPDGFVDAGTLPKVASSHAPSVAAEGYTHDGTIPQRGVTEINVFKFDPMPSSKEWRNWNLAFKKKVRGGALKPQESYEWISEALKAKSWESLSDDGRFETLNYKIASGLMEICTGEFKRKLLFIERQLDELTPPRTLNGRQMY